MGPVALGTVIIRCWWGLVEERVGIVDGSVTFSRLASTSPRIKKFH